MKGGRNGGVRDICRKPGNTHGKSLAFSRNTAQFSHAGIWPRFFFLESPVHSSRPGTQLIPRKCLLPT